MKFSALLVAFVLAVAALLGSQKRADAQLLVRAGGTTVSVNGFRPNGLVFRRPFAPVIVRPRPLLRLASLPFRVAASVAINPFRRIIVPQQRIVVAPARVVVRPVLARPVVVRQLIRPVHLGHNAYVQSQLLVKDRLQLNRINSYGLLPTATAANIVYRPQGVTYSAVAGPERIVSLPSTQPSYYASGAESVTITEKVIVRQPAPAITYSSPAPVVTAPEAVTTTCPNCAPAAPLVTTPSGGCVGGSPSSFKPY